MTSVARGLTRRELLAAGSIGAMGLGIPGCVQWRCFGLPEAGPALDVHCHVFNARDLPIRSFAETVLLHQNPGLLRGVLLAFQYALQSPAPDYDSERELLQGLIDGEEAALDLLEDLDPPAGLLNEALDHVQQQDAEAYDELLLEQGLEPGLEADGALLGTIAERAVNWAYVMTRYRTQIAHKLARTFEQVALFTPALVDFDLWLGEHSDVRTSLERQVELYGLLAEWSEGRFHGFVAFDPLRELRDPGGNGGTLARVKEAVQQHGFVGVKVYPPMGFRPLGNAELWPPGDLRRELDTPLRVLYAWCQSENVPILAHCNASNGAGPGYSLRAAPVHWARALQEFPELRLCLGHFGGTAGLRQNPPESWAWQIGQLMQTHEFVYADTSFHDVGLDATEAERQAYLNGVAWLVATFPAARERLVFGSDWQMILIEEGHADYLNRYRRQIEERLGASAARDFTENNARRLLGLDAVGKGNRSRLEEFYEARAMPKPSWWRV
jgi:predicted TIM-barrel fold metal-dependent hydrolase